ncbi:ATP-binding cassette domain-containing protein [Nannocystis sp.]|uniref:ATP-binding cassette domain-containing protein n=1 Tax=Nannocystis sp. TaxID=1962667 RepID=UPI0025E57410|nr:ATP-binding cassette domain-containing protein [Nannocystis sp.]MBK7824663.1 ATP-binding cassette domain-containing protein [Nannocystis sp.]
MQVLGLGCALNSRSLLADIDLELVDGPLALLGPSGAGKSLALRCMLGLAPPRSTVRGELVLKDGRRARLDDLRTVAGLRGRGLCLLPQDAGPSLDPVRRVEAQLRELLRVHDNRDDSPASLLVQVGVVEELLRRYPHQLSGGQAQRVALALALACRPALLLADEPSSALDTIAQAQLVDTLRVSCAARSTELVFVTHDLALAARLCVRAVVLDVGRVVEAGPLAGLIAAPAHPVTQALVAAARRADALFVDVLETRS